MESHLKDALEEVAHRRHLNETYARALLRGIHQGYRFLNELADRRFRVSAAKATAFCRLVDEQLNPWCFSVNVSSGTKPVVVRERPCGRSTLDTNAIRLGRKLILELSARAVRAARQRVELSVELVNQWRIEAVSMIMEIAACRNVDEPVRLAIAAEIRDYDIAIVRRRAA